MQRMQPHQRSRANRRGANRSKRQSRPEAQPLRGREPQWHRHQSVAIPGCRRLGIRENESMCNFYRVTPKRGTAGSLSTKVTDSLGKLAADLVRKSDQTVLKSADPDGDAQRATGTFLTQALMRTRQWRAQPRSTTDQLSLNTKNSTCCARSLPAKSPTSERTIRWASGQGAISGIPPDDHPKMTTCDDHPRPKIRKIPAKVVIFNPVFAHSFQCLPLNCAINSHPLCR